MKDSFELTPGDIILYKGKSALSKSIMKFMEVYRKRKGIEKREVFSHAAMIIDVWGVTYVAEALGKGITVKPFDETYAKVLDRVKILTPKKPYSKIEKERISKVAANNAFEPTRYDFLNFIYQMEMIIKSTKDNDSWKGPEGDKAERRLYCSEAVATWANEIRPNTFDKPWSVNPLNIDLNKYYNVKFDGTIKE